MQAVLLNEDNIRNYASLITVITYESVVSNSYLVYRELLGTEMAAGHLIWKCTRRINPIICATFNIETNF